MVLLKSVLNFLVGENKWKLILRIFQKYLEEEVFL